MAENLERIANRLGAMEARARQTASNWLRPEQFKGTSSDNARQWLDKFNLYSVASHLDNAARIIHFKAAMDGPAYQWFTATIEDDATWPNIQAAFTAKFINDQSMKWMLRQELDVKLQGQTQPVEEYVNEVKALCLRLGLDDGEIKNTLLRGMRPDIKAFVLTQSPQNSAEVEEKARLAEISERVRCNPTANAIAPVEGLVKTMQDYLEESKALRQALNQRVEGERSQFPRPRCQLCQLQGHTAQTCMRRNRPQPMAQGNASMQRPQGQFPQSRDSNITCYFCGKQGHVQRDCRLKSRYPGQGPRGPPRGPPRPGN